MSFFSQHTSHPHRTTRITLSLLTANPRYSALTSPHLTSPCSLVVVCSVHPQAARPLPSLPPRPTSPPAPPLPPMLPQPPPPPTLHPTSAPLPPPTPPAVSTRTTSPTSTRTSATRPTKDCAPSNAPPPSSNTQSTVKSLRASRPSSR